jgi:ankyrin repeat protein
MKALFVVMIALCVPAAAQPAGRDEELLEAARRGELARVKELLAMGANIEAQTRHGITPLYYAAWSGHAEVVRYLASRGAKLDVSDTFYKMPAYAAALNKGRTEAVKALIEAGLKDPWELLAMAASRGNKEIVALLLARGGAPAEQLSAALEQAERGGQVEIAGLLRKAGAVPPKKPDFQVDAAALASYAGAYRGEPLGEATVVLKEGKLFLSAQGQTHEMGAFDKENFGLIQVPQVKFRFVTEGGKVTGAVLTQGASVVNLKRVEAK